MKDSKLIPADLPDHLRPVSEAWYEHYMTTDATGLGSSQHSTTGKCINSEVSRPRINAAEAVIIGLKIDLQKRRAEKEDILADRFQIWQQMRTYKAKTIQLSTTVDKLNKEIKDETMQAALVEERRALEATNQKLHFELGQLTEARETALRDKNNLLRLLGSRKGLVHGGDEADVDHGSQTIALNSVITQLQEERTKDLERIQKLEQEKNDLEREKKDLEREKTDLERENTKLCSEAKQASARDVTLRGQLERQRALIAAEQESRTAMEAESAEQAQALAARIDSLNQDLSTHARSIGLVLNHVATLASTIALARFAPHFSPLPFSAVLASFPEFAPRLDVSLEFARCVIQDVFLSVSDGRRSVDGVTRKDLLKRLHDWHAGHESEDDGEGGGMHESTDKQGPWVLIDGVQPVDQPSRWVIEVTDGLASAYDDVRLKIDTADT